MGAIQSIIRGGALALALACASRPASCAESVEVTYLPLSDHGVIRTSPLTGAVHFDTGFGDGIRSGRRVMDDSEIAGEIRSAAARYRTLSVTLRVCNPETNDFSTVCRSVERLQKAAVASATSGCNVRIVVFPSPRIRFDPPAAPNLRVQ